MKKTSIFLLLILLLGVTRTFYGQTVNNVANWPNSNWTITGTYDSSPSAFAADPRTTSNFSFDDRGAPYGQTNTIAAESPVIDLTAAHANGETLLSLDVQYSYKDYSYIGQSLVIEYWDAAMSFWLPWHGVEGNSDSGGYYCYQSKSKLLLSGLNISNFSATTLANFKYRIRYSDPTDGSFGWGFCFDSPTLKSNFPVAVPDCAINPYPADGATNVPAGPLNSTWEPATTGGTPTFYKVLFGLDSSSMTYRGSFEGTSLYSIISLYSQDYYTKVIPVNLAGEAQNCPVWHFTSEDIPPVPANDVCSGAIPIDVQPQGSNCSSPILMNNYSANNSSVLSGIPAASCCYQDDNSGDLWYSFTAPASGDIKITNMWTGDEWTSLGYVIYDDCAATNEILCNSLNDTESMIHTGFTPGNTYFLRIFDTSPVPDWKATKRFCIEAYTPPASPPVNDECESAINLDIQYDMIAFAATTPVSGTIDGATDSGVPGTTCTDGSNPIPNDDVWYKFTAGIDNLHITINDAYQTNCTVELFSGTCDNLQQISCSSGGNNPTIDATGLIVGDDYYVRVYSDEEIIPSEPVFGISVWTEGDNPNSIANSNITGFTMYPNPVSDVLALNSDNSIDVIEIYNMLGEKLIEYYPNLNHFELNTKKLSPGTYLVKVQAGTQNGIYKLIKK